MMIDFALEAEREEGKVARGGHLSGLPAALPAHHDDDDGRAARRSAAGARRGRGSELRRPLGITIVGGLIFSQIAHALHHSGGLSLLRSPGAAAQQAARAISHAWPNRAHGLGGLRAGDHAYLRTLHSAAGRHLAAERRARCWRAPWPIRSAARCVPARSGLSRHRRAERGCPAPARRRWPPPSPRRSSVSSAASPASTR